MTFTTTRFGKASPRPLAVTVLEVVGGRVTGGPAVIHDRGNNTECDRQEPERPPRPGAGDHGKTVDDLGQHEGTGPGGRIGPGHEGPSGVVSL